MRKKKEPPVEPADSAPAPETETKSEKSDSTEIEVKRAYYDSAIVKQYASTKFDFTPPADRASAIAELMLSATEKNPDPVFGILVKAFRRMAIKAAKQNVQIPEGAIRMVAFRAVAGPLTLSLRAINSKLTRKQAAEQVRAQIAESPALIAAINAMNLALPDVPEDEDEEEDSDES